MDNGEDWQKPNVFGRAALESLGELLPQLRDGAWRGLVLTGKPFVFAAGADLTEFPEMTTPELARAAAKAGHDAFAAIRDLPYPDARRDQRRRARRRPRDRAPLRLPHARPLGAPHRLPRGLPRDHPRLGRHPARAAPRRRRRGGRADRHQPAEAEPAPARGAGGRSSGSPTSCSTTSSSSTTRSSGSSRAIEEQRAPRAAADLSDAAEVCAKARYAVDDAVHGVALAPYRALDLIAGSGGLDDRGGLRRRGGCARRSSARPAGAGRRSTRSTSSSGASRRASASPRRSHGGSRRSASSERA